MTETNWYIEVTQAETEQDAIKALGNFLADELERSWERLDEATDGMSPPEEAGEVYSEALGTTYDYEKGRLDTLRLLHGMVMQAKWSTAAARQHREDMEGDDAG